MKKLFLTAIVVTAILAARQSQAQVVSTNLYDNGTNIGIGTTSPIEKLQVMGNIKLNSSRGEIYSEDRNHMIVFRGLEDGTAKDITAYYQYGGNLSEEKGHRFFTGGWHNVQTERMRISNDGIYMRDKLGIGTTSPEETLDVNGNIKIAGNLVSDGDICIGACE